MAKSLATSANRKMEYVEITQAEEMPVLSDTEHTDLIKSLEDAELRLEAGEGITFKPGEFGDWMRERMKEHRSNRKRAV
jgi:hypothetical protein